ncbi:MAG: hypothetical protein N3B13_02700 [Deltaproteobacteria bacterium]|nr:hypothetical protein [Deltaproteobacteria bacterium]
MKRYICFCILFALLLFSCTQREISNFSDSPDTGQQDTFIPFRIPLKEDWYLISSEQISDSVEEMLRSDYDLSRWYKISMPSSVVAGLVENGVYRDIFRDKKLRELPGMGYPIGSSFTDFDMPEDSPFKVPWLYRGVFEMPSLLRGKKVFLRFEGINYSAKIYLNGRQIADNKDVRGIFRTFEFDITDYARFGEKNFILTKIAAPDPKSLSLTWVDWNPYPPDKNMGILNDVYLIVRGDVGLENTQVVTDFDTGNPGKAYLTIYTTVRNYSDREREIGILCEIERIRFEKRFKINPNETREIMLSHNEIKELIIDNPRLWWVHTIGRPELYTLNLSLYVDGLLSDSEKVRFGIRKVESELINGDTMLFKLNGRNVLILGGGYAPDMLYRIDGKRERYEMEYIRDMGLNAIRLEGKLGLDNLINLADEYGVFVLASFCCCDMWERWGVWREEHYNIAYQSLRDQIRRLRNHPSLLLWLNGADFHPPPDVEREYLKILKEERINVPVTSSATEADSEVSGKSGVKMNGPYDWVPPNYWYEDTKFGGAFSFNTEVGIGPAIPEYESLVKFISGEFLWPINDVWNYHAGGGAFKNIDYFIKSVSGRFKGFSDLNEFIYLSQLMAYEGERAMFEAHIRNRYRTSGVIKWMLNNAWPSVIWHLYDYYLKPSGGYFGAKHAMRPVHIFYAYDNDGIYISNRTYNDYSRLRYEIRLYDSESREIYTKAGETDLSGDGLRLLENISDRMDSEDINFLWLRLIDSKGNTVDRNFYWLKKKKDVPYWDRTEWYYTPTKEYADYSLLKAFRRGEVGFEMKRINDFEYEVDMKNKRDKIVFFKRITLTDSESGEEVKPVLYEDNFISLLPKEELSIKIRVFDKRESLSIVMSH